MKNSLISLFLILSFNVFSQIQEGKIIEYKPQESVECVPKALREQINLQLKENLKKYLNPQIPNLAHPLFILPLRKIASLTDYDFYSIVNFVDQNSAVGPNSINQYGSTNSDYNCGNRTYDTNTGYNHQGIDFTLYPFSWTKMENNEVEVIAAASGTIINKNDGNSSYSCGSNTSPNWNAMYVRHTDNSVAWYGHLKAGTLTAKSIGSTVVQGEYLGVAGSSGNSSEPHLHFEVYDANNQLIDPFYGTCNTKNSDTWWQNQIPYYNKIINAITTHQVQPVVFQCPSTANYPNISNNLVKGVSDYFYFWGKNIQLNNTINISIIRPNGTVFSTYNITSNDNYPTFYYWLSYSFATNEPSGIWTVRAVFDGITYNKTFNLYSSSDCLSVLDLVNSADNFSTGTIIKQVNSTNGHISATNRISGNANVTYRAGNYVMLNAGFESAKGTVFKTESGGCSN